MNVKVIYNDIDENKQPKLSERNLDIILIEEENENCIRFLTKNGAGEDLVIYSQDFRGIVVNTYESQKEENKTLMKEMKQILGKHNIVYHNDLKDLQSKWF